MKNYYIHNFLLVLVLFVLNLNIKSQTFKINKTKSTIIINGNTNVHNFKSNVTEIDGVLVINASKQVKLLEVYIPVQSIKSGEKLMDKKTYEAFDSKKFPTILFQLTNSSIKMSNENIIEVDLTGNLSMSGVKKAIRFKPTGKQIGKGTYQFIGSIPLKLSDFKMIPPTFMLGAMRVYDDIVLKYDIVVEETREK